MSRTLTFLTSIIVVLVAVSHALSDDQTTAPAIPSLDVLRQPARFKEYADTARQFLRNHGDSPEAARVTFDLMMLFSVSGHTAEETQFRQILLAVHPLSPYSAYALGHFKSAEECREFLQDFYTKGVLARPADPALSQFAIGANFGVDRFGAELISDEDFLLQCIFAGSRTGVMSLGKRGEEKLKTVEEETRQIAAILLDSERTTVERFSGLQPFTQRSGVRKVLPLLRAELTPEQTESPSVRRSLAESLLRDRKFKQVYPILADLSEIDADPRIAVWAAWAAVAAGDRPGAIRRLKDLATTDDHPQRELAARLASALTSMDDSLEEHTTALLGVGKSLTEMQSAIELAGRYAADDGTSLKFYVAFDAAADFAEVVVERGERTLAVRIDGERAAAQFPGEDVRHVFETGAAIPRPKLQVTRDDDGQFSFKFNIGTDEPGSNDPLRTLFQSPLLSTGYGLQALFSASIERGSVPEFRWDIKSESRVLTWLSFDMDSNEPSVTELRITPAGNLTSLRLDKLDVHRIRHGDHASFEFHPPEWPERRIKQHESVPPSMMFQLVTVVTTLLESSE